MALPHFVSHWEDEYLINCYLGGISFSRHPFTNVVIAWLHCLNTIEIHRNHRQKSQQQRKAVFILPCPRMEPRQTRTLRPVAAPYGPSLQGSPGSLWAGREGLVEEERGWGCNRGRTAGLPKRGLFTEKFMSYQPPQPCLLQIPPVPLCLVGILAMWVSPAPQLLRLLWQCL